MVLAAVGQICSTASMAHNLAQCTKLATKAAAAGARVLFLPEASDYIGSSASESVSLCKPISSSPFVLGLQLLASKHSLAINVGIHTPSPASSKLYNTLLHISPGGALLNQYHKLHLFDLDLSASDGPKLQESASTSPGSALLAPVDTEVGRIGSLICFDLRFPEASLALRRQGAEVLLYPSAFTPKTGKVHWETLLRARAIENQCWVVAAAQVGKHNEKRESYGRTMVVNPWGEIVAELPGLEDWTSRGDAWEPDMAVVDIDLGQVARVREGMPLFRREDVYGRLHPASSAS